MRRIIVSMNVTLNGCMADAGGGLNWHLQNWTSDMAQLLGQQLSRADTLLLGRNTYTEMAGYWPAVSRGLYISREDIPYADLINKIEKVVYSSTLKQPGWNNSRTINGNLRRQIVKLKQQFGKDIIVYGSRTLVQELIRYNLVDEYILWMYPIAMAQGRALFKHAQNLKLVRSHQFPSGVVVLHYAVAN
ncbi:dihydrofolate reductase family protein [Mucilaginibacter sp. UYCu711]|uniref:dihydrofolate reductase family protein n=1 Tax=Mucilaginibacter sp. UYCu711 TaxID=3156339 RepID=UPI003D2574A7